MVNILVIASHHGAFLTLQSILDHKEEVENLMVVIPNSTVEKYNKDPEAIFRDFKDNTIAFSKKFKGVKTYIGDWEPSNPFTCSSSYLEDSSGVWLVLTAGSVFNGITGWQPRLDQMKDIRYGLVKERMYQKSVCGLDMYHMVGFDPPAAWNDHFKQIFLINADKLPPVHMNETMALQDAASNGMLRLMSPFMFPHPDELVVLALGALDIMLLNAKSMHSLAMNFWSAAITSPDRLEDECYHGFPLDVYGALAKKVKKYIPNSSYVNIQENSKITDNWVSGLRELVLD